MLEPETGIIVGDKLNFDQSFMQFSVKKEYMRKVTLKEECQFDWKW